MLLILGNGFDIQCGLKTDYLSFFKERYNEQRFIDLKKCISQVEVTRYDANNTEHSLESEIITVYDLYKRYNDVLFKKMSLWDFVFIYEDILAGNPGWYNIENLIFDYISNNKVTYASIIGVEKKINNTSLIKNDRLNLILYMLFNKMKIAFTPMKFNEWLLEQLKIIEKSFKEYVIKELDNNRNKYDERTWDFYNYFTTVKDYDHKPLSLINFNYTTPNIGGDNLQYFTNIHGNINQGEIIFGIDEKNSKEDSWIEPSDTKYLFTKTARKIHAFENNENFIVNKNRDKNILIYGHSLNEQDYSYFQSVFDIYNISEGDTIIYVAWSSYDKNRKIRALTVNNAIRLLKYYGNSLRNDRGKNLLHRMLLEKRIRIIEVPNINA